MKYSYNWLKQLVGFKESPKDIADFLTLYSFEIKSVERHKKDWILDIDVLPNRTGDCLSHIGVAREVALVLGKKLKPRNLAFKESRKRTDDFIKIEVEDPEICSRYAVQAIEEVKIKPSPRFVKERLEACGLRSINNVVDIVNYVMLEIGQPLHAFDFDKVQSKAKKKTIYVRRAKAGEHLIDLEGNDLKLEGDIVIADDVGPMALAGIRGGKDTLISDYTHTILLEGANFSPIEIRRSSRKFKLRTDAAIRFEAGIDPNLVEAALDRAAALISKYAGGKVLKGIVDEYPKKRTVSAVQLRTSQVNNLLGLSLKDKDIVLILRRLGFVVKIKRSKDSLFAVSPSTLRLDLSIPEDIVEEIGRVYGLMNIKSRSLYSIAAIPQRNENLFWAKKARDTLISLGFSEVYNFSFVSKKQLEDLGVDTASYIEVKNPVSSDLNLMRKNLIAGLLQNCRGNLKNYDSANLFEIGKVYNPEKIMLAGAIARKEPQKDLYREVKGAVDLALEKLGIDEYFYDEFKATPDYSESIFWHPSKSAEIKIEGLQEVGFVGEIHPLTLARIGIKGQIVAFEVDFGKLIKIATEEREYQKISQYAPLTRDISILVSADKRISQVENVIYSAGGQSLEDIEFVDIYEQGEGIAPDQKSLTFRLVFQSQEKSLTDQEIVSSIQNIISVLQDELGAEIR